MPVYLGFDHGEKRVGVALGDDLTGAARPLPAITDGDWTAIGRVIADWRPAALIVGLPLNDDGSEQKASAAARRSAGQPAQHYQLPVERKSAAQGRRVAGRVAHGGRRRLSKKKNIDKDH